MAIVGQVLTTPETGFKRYDDTNSVISYLGAGWSTFANGAYYNGSRHQCANTSINPQIQFKFLGSSITLISTLYSGYSNDIEVSIDGVLETASQSASTANQAVFYTKTGLPFRTHTVSLTKKVAGTYSADFILDAIDIDDTGELYPYSYVPSTPGTVTWNPDDKGTGVTLSNGNLTWSGAGINSGVRTNLSKSSGKWYWELTIEIVNYIALGIANSNASLAWIYNGAYGNTARLYNLTGVKYPGSLAYGAAFTTGDKIGVALDIDNGTITFYKNGVSQGVAFTDISLLGTSIYPYVVNHSTSTTPRCTANFGATAFAYPIPDGYLSLEDPTGQYTLIIDVFDHIGADSATITEIQLLNGTTLIPYTVNASDYSDPGQTRSWWASSVWNYQNLNDGDLVYTDTATGGASSTIFLYSTPINSGHWARFSLDIGTVKPTSVKIYAGSPENRIPKTITVYIVDKPLYSVADNITARSNVNLTLVGKIDFSISNTSVSSWTLGEPVPETSQAYCFVV